MSNHIEKVLVAGTGYMAREYIKVLKALETNYIVVGNREETVKRFVEETGESAYCGGVEQYIAGNSKGLEYAIVAVSPGNIFRVAKALAEAGVKKILLEKPGVTSLKEAEELIQLAERFKTKIYIAYNRRFYQSVQKALQLIREDGGLQSVVFEFTEWAHIVEETTHSDEIKQKWFLLNSSHVVDLVFYLAGCPQTLKTQIDGGLVWHKAGSIYTGCGITERGIPFTYHANWGAPGRWGIELLTAKHRFYLKPLEKLQIQNSSSIKVEQYSIEDEIDQQFKAGLYLEVQTFLFENQPEEVLCTLKEQLRNMSFYQKISGEVY